MRSPVFLTRGSSETATAEVILTFIRNPRFLNMVPSNDSQVHSTTRESEINFVVPKELDPGTYTLMVTTTKVGSDVVNFTVE